MAGCVLASAIHVTCTWPQASREPTGFGSESLSQKLFNCSQKGHLSDYPTWVSTLLLGHNPIRGTSTHSETLSCLCNAVSAKHTILNTCYITQCMTVWKQMYGRSRFTGCCKKMKITHLLIAQALVEVRLDPYLLLGYLDSIISPSRNHERGRGRGRRSSTSGRYFNRKCR